jgi:hypothetical protein
MSMSTVSYRRVPAAMIAALLCAGAALAGSPPVNAPRLVALVRAGARFERGKLVERPPSPTPTSTQAA